MSDNVLSIENPSVPWTPCGETNAATEVDPVSDSENLLPLSQVLPLTPELPASIDRRVEEIRRYNLVFDESTEIEWRPISKSSVWCLSWNTKVEFLNARELAAWYLPAGFPTVDESLPSPNPYSHTWIETYTKKLRVNAASIDPYNHTRIETELDHLFSAAQEEQFETGMESRFARGLGLLFADASKAVLRSLKTRVNIGKTAPQVLAEMLEWSSRQEKNSFGNEIIDLLLTGLKNPSPLVRDSAALSLAYFDEDTAIDHLKRAMQEEQVPELRMDLEDLVNSLRT